MQPGGALDASTPALGRSVPCFMQSRKPGIPPTTESLSVNDDFDGAGVHVVLFGPVPVHAGKG